MSGTERVFKVLVIGEPKVGKTAFVARYCTKEWLTNYKATIGGECMHSLHSWGYQVGVQSTAYRKGKDPWRVCSYIIIIMRLL